MGKYINSTSQGTLGSSFDEKVTAIKADGGKMIEAPSEFMPNLVCVVDNGHFAAAAYCFDEKERKRFIQDRYNRRWQWFVYDKVEQLVEL